MMNNVIIAPQFRIFVLQYIKTMRAGGYDFFNAIIIQGPDILVSHHLENKFIARPPYRVAGTHFFFAQYRIVYSNFIKNSCKCPGDLLRPLIKTTGTAYPK